MVKLLSAIGFLAGICLVGSCSKTQNYGGTAVEKVANGWWINAYSSKNGLLTTSMPVFFNTYNTSANTADSVWADDLGYIGAPYDVKAELAVDLADYTLSSGGTANLYEDSSAVQWAGGKVFPKGGLSRTGMKTDSLFLQFLFVGDPGDTLTIKGVARTGFDGDDWPASPYTPAP